MADSTTSVYQFVLPEIGASEDTWGTKLNADLTKLEALLISGFDGGTPTAIGTVKGSVIPTDLSGNRTILNGDLTVKSASPNLYFEETDQTDPLGRFRFQVSAADISLQRALTAAWATSEDVWQYELPTNIFNFLAPLWVNITGDLSIKNTLPVIWLQDTNAPSAKDWAIWSTTGRFNLGLADSAGSPVTSYFEISGTQTFVYNDIFKIQSSYPTLAFSDTTPSGDQHFAITGGNGSIRFSTADSVGALQQTIAWMNRATGLRVTATDAGAGDIFADGKVTGSLVHEVYGGYFLLGSFDNTHGNGSGRLFWDQNFKELLVYSSAGNDAAVRAGSFLGDGSSLTGITSSQIVTASGGVGSYRLLLGPNGGHTSGTIYAGSSLSTPHLQVNISSTAMDMSYTGGPSGSWMAMQTGTCSTGETVLGLFRRTS